MSSLGAGKGLLEVGKFAVYITVPIVLMYAFANHTKNLQKFGGVCSPFLTLLFQSFFFRFSSVFYFLTSSIFRNIYRIFIDFFYKIHDLLGFFSFYVVAD